VGTKHTLTITTIRAHAKINLDLRVLGTRADGFHELRTVFQAISLYDTLACVPREGPFAIECATAGMPLDETNLIWRAAQALWTSLRRPGAVRDVVVRVEKRIPMQGGLGGGSADAAAALVGLSVLWSSNLRLRDLSRLGAELGADVPFFLQGGTALGTGKGEELYPVDDLPRLTVVVIKPSFGVQTADAYAWLDENRARSVTPPEPAPPSELDLGWPGGPLALINDLQAPVADRHPAVREIVKALKEAGARAAAMTGSGSAVYGLFSQTVARTALRRLQRPDWLVIQTRTSDRREASRRIGCDKLPGLRRARVHQ
jgi:4-diphosphocytidyl-2-C-methyl-D-erythritol kinase